MEEQVRHLLLEGKRVEVIAAALGVSKTRIYTRTRAYPERFPRALARHFLSEIDEARRIALCTVCGPTAIQKQGEQHGHTRWRCRASERWRTSRRRRKRNRLIVKYKDSQCSICGFMAERPCQLDLHRVDGNPQNHAAPNLQTVCANCHRLISWREREVRFASDHTAAST
jgi:hypothetical protein